MNKGTFHIMILALLLLPLLRPLQAMAFGDHVIPHVVNGLDPFQQLTYRTKFDISNLSTDSSTPITKVTVLFRKADGTPWTLETDQGNVNQVLLNLGASQTIRITTLGFGTFDHGYVIVRNLEANTQYAEDFQVGITVYYEVLSGGKIIETVSVPLGQRTVSWGFPVENDSSKGLGTGFAIVDLSGQSNQVDLQLYKASVPTSDPVSGFLGQPVSLPLKGNEKQARMLTEDKIFPTATNFRGMLRGNSQGPVAILALEITPVAAGAQYATMVPAYFDSLRRNTMMYLPQGYALDADLPTCDYFHYELDPVDLDLETPWDVLFQTLSGTPNGSARGFVPQQGATLSIIGEKDPLAFDGITQDYLRGLTYSSATIDMSDSSSNFKVNFTFAIKTGLGQYVKVRVRDYVGYTDSAYKDLMLEIFIYK